MLKGVKAGNVVQLHDPVAAAALVRLWTFQARAVGMPAAKPSRELYDCSARSSAVNDGNS